MRSPHTSLRRSRSRARHRRSSRRAPHPRLPAECPGRGEFRQGWWVTGRSCGFGEVAVAPRSVDSAARWAWAGPSPAADRLGVGRSRESAPANRSVGRPVRWSGAVPMAPPSVVCRVVHRRSGRRCVPSRTSTIREAEANQASDGATAAGVTNRRDSCSGRSGGSCRRSAAVHTQYSCGPATRKASASTPTRSAGRVFPSTRVNSVMARSASIAGPRSVSDSHMRVRLGRCDTRRSPRFRSTESTACP